MFGKALSAADNNKINKNQSAPLNKLCKYNG